MIYATMCVGRDWCEVHSSNINYFAKNNKLHILTDFPDYFNNCEIHPYKRDIFSYYEKLNHIINLLEELKTRITYIDADWISFLNTNLEYDMSSLYSYDIFKLNSELLQNYFSEKNIEDLSKIFSMIGVNNVGNEYIPEALISFPYVNNIIEIKKDLKILQTPLENMYSYSPEQLRLKRYSKNGVGYGEGWALTAICVKYGIPFTSIDWRKKSII